MARGKGVAAVVGSGPNGLAAAIALAQAGLEVTLYEKNEVIGGGCRSLELIQKGYIHDICSTVHLQVRLSPFFRKLPLEELADLMTARQRPKIQRTFRPEEEKLLDEITSGKEGIKTHLRDAIVLPSMVGTKIGIHDGKGFEFIEIKPEMIGHYLGELALTRKKVAHGAAGVGATRSSKYVPLK